MCLGSHYSDLRKPIDEIRTGSYRQLFHPELLISGKEDAANNCKTLLGFRCSRGPADKSLQMLAAITLSERSLSMV